MPVGVLAVISWNNLWPNPRLQLGSSVALCTPQTSCLKPMLLWKIARLGQGMLCHRRAPSAELPLSQTTRKWCFSTSLRTIAATYCIWRACSSPGGKGCFRLKHSLAIAPSVTKLRPEKGRIVQQYFLLLNQSTKEDSATAVFVSWVPLPTRAG